MECVPQPMRPRPLLHRAPLIWSLPYVDSLFDLLYELQLGMLLQVNHLWGHGNWIRGKGRMGYAGGG